MVTSLRHRGSMATEVTMHGADLERILQLYTTRLHHHIRAALTPQEAAAVHAECWNFTLKHPQASSVFLSLPVNEVVWLRDTCLAGIAANHYGYPADAVVAFVHGMVA
ncbi:MAG TPA: hypothetical protein DDY88_02365 [Actinobacteria bacterium]|nr:hypothetical protein [Actinomycetota bacterium]